MLSIENLEAAFTLAGDFSAPSLAKRCCLYALEHFGELVTGRGGEGCAELLRVMVRVFARAVCWVSCVHRWLGFERWVMHDGRLKDCTRPLPTAAPTSTLAHMHLT